MPACTPQELGFIIRQGYCNGVMDANVVGGLGGSDSGYRVNGEMLTSLKGGRKCVRMNINLKMMQMRKTRYIDRRSVVSRSRIHAWL